MPNHRVSRREFLRFAGAAALSLQPVLSLRPARLPGSQAQELYCYVDETGQESLGKFFIVSAVVITENREALEARLDAIETESAKGRRQWRKVTVDRRLAYITQILQEPALSRALYHSISRDVADLTGLTVSTAVQAINLRGVPPCQATVVIDGLSDAKQSRVAEGISSRNIPTGKVLKAKDNWSALARLADAMSGFVREAVITQRPEFRDLFEQAKQQGILVELNAQQKTPA